MELPDPVVNDDGTVTYTYTLVDGLKWSDGKDLTAKDFEFAWKRAASSELGADYGYMFEVIKGYTADGSDPKAENLAVTAVDNKTLTVTLMATIREILGSGTWLGFQVLPDSIARISIMTQAPGAFFCYGVLMAGCVWLEGKLDARIERKSCCDIDNLKKEAE